MIENKKLKDLVELHVHLGSATTAHLLWEMAYQQGIRLEEKDYWKFVSSIEVDGDVSFDEYLKNFDLTEMIQSTPQAVERSVYDAVSLSYRKSDINLLEIRFNPMKRNREGLYDLDRIIFAAIVGMKKAMMEYPIKVGLIITTDRGFSKSQTDVLVDKAIKFRDEGVVGIDLSGPQRDGFSIEHLQGAYKKAREAGLGTTIHTGEQTSSDEMMQALKLLKPDRIGHGIKAAYSEDLIKELQEQGTILEICPTSNVVTGVVKGWDEIGSIIRKFKESGINFTINSDGPVFLKTNVRKEYQKLIELGVLTSQEAIDINELARKSTFIK